MKRAKNCIARIDSQLVLIMMLLYIIRVLTKQTMTTAKIQLYMTQEAKE